MRKASGCTLASSPSVHAGHQGDAITTPNNRRGKTGEEFTQDGYSLESNSFQPFALGERVINIQGVDKGPSA